MKVWLIKHKPTNEWMPARMSRSGRGGWSWWIPGHSGYAGFDKNPRVFFTARSAQAALTQWLQGPKMLTTHNTSGSYFGPPESFTTVDKADDVPGMPVRRREDISVVEAELVLP